MDALINYGVRVAARGVYWGDQDFSHCPPWLMSRIVDVATRNPHLGPYAIAGVINHELDCLDRLFVSIHRWAHRAITDSLNRYGQLELE